MSCSSAACFSTGSTTCRTSGRVPRQGLVVHRHQHRVVERDRDRFIDRQQWCLRSGIDPTASPAQQRGRVEPADAQGEQQPQQQLPDQLEGSRCGGVVPKRCLTRGGDVVAGRGSERRTGQESPDRRRSATTAGRRRSPRSPHLARRRNRHRRCRLRRVPPASPAASTRAWPTNRDRPAGWRRRQPRRTERGWESTRCSRTRGSSAGESAVQRNRAGRRERRRDPSGSGNGASTVLVAPSATGTTMYRIAYGASSRPPRSVDSVAI